MPPQRTKGLGSAQRLDILMWDHKRALHGCSVSVVHRISLSAWLSRFASVCSRSISSRHEQASLTNKAKKQTRGERGEQSKQDARERRLDVIIIISIPCNGRRSLFHPQMTRTSLPHARSPTRCCCRGGSHCRSRLAYGAPPFPYPPTLVHCPYPTTTLCSQLAGARWLHCRPGSICVSDSERKRGVGG